MRLSSSTEAELYHRLADAIGEPVLDQRRPVQHIIADLLATPTSERCAVYAAIGGDGTMLYVGSVCRNEPAAVAARLREHLKEGLKAATWNTVWIFPLRPTTPVELVRQAESRVATLTGRLLHNRALPRRPLAPT
jgi:hypothetical protein